MRGEPASAWRPFLALAAMLMLPSLPAYLFGASSLAAGLVLACLCIAMIAPWSGSGSSRTRAPLMWLFLFSFAVSHLVLSRYFSTVDFARGGLSILLLMVLAFMLKPTLRAIFLVSPRDLHRAIQAVFFVMLLCAVVALAGLIPLAARSLTKPVFPFTEPSYYALSIAPLLMYMAAAASRGGRALVLISGFAMAYFLESLTLAVSCILVLVVCTRWRGFEWFLGAACIAFVFLVGLNFDSLSYFTQRLDFSSPEENLSSLVYLQGWQLLGSALHHSYGWGLGFQQLGVSFHDAAASDIIYTLLGEYLNLQDGGFTLAKLVAEFGLFGIAAAGFYLILFASAAWQVRKAAMLPRRRLPTPRLFALCVIVCYALELFVRGGGYFTGTGFLFMVAVYFVSADAWTEPARRPKPGAGRGDRSHSSVASNGLAQSFRRDHTSSR